MSRDQIIRADSEDLERLHRLLKDLSREDRAAFAKRLAKQEESRVLDLACGECREAELLARFLDEVRLEGGGGPDGAVRLTGIDVRAREIDDARRRFGGKRSARTEGRPATESEFLVGDASKLDKLRELGDEFDLVFLRHQNYWNGADTWEQIFEQALGKLDDDGRLVITSYFDREHELALEAISRLGGELVESVRNPDSRILPTPGKSVDRHVALFRKKR